MIRIASFAAAMAIAAPAVAQQVDYYDFRELEKRLERAESDLQLLRNAVSGGDAMRRFETLEAEISRLTGALEQLEFRQRQQEQQTKQKLEDLEYRIIELEGGDPSILFDNNTDTGLQNQGALQAPAAPEPQGGTLGVLTTNQGGQTVASAGATPELAEFNTGVSAAKAGRSTEARQVLQGFVNRFPDSPLAGDAYYWLGEAHFTDGDYQNAASRFLDSATLYPTGALAPDSLVRLGVTLNLIGQNQVACSTLREVRQRYPGAAEAVRKADVEAQRAGCV